MGEFKINKTLEESLYVAQSIIVVEIGTRSVICQSGGLQNARRYDGTWED